MNVSNQVLSGANLFLKTSKTMQSDQSGTNRIIWSNHRMIFFMVAFFIIISFLAPASYAATMLFKSNFGSGVSLESPDIFDNDRASQAIKGTDKQTGYTWPATAIGSDFGGIQMITTDPITSWTLPDYAFNDIQEIPGPKGDLVNALFQNLKNKAPAGTWDAQSPLMIQRPATVADVTNLYITYWYKLPAASIAQLDPSISSADTILQFQFKTGGYNDTFSAGDYRTSIGIVQGKDGKLYWRTHADNRANGPGPKIEYWDKENHTVSVPIDTWYKVEIFWNRSSGSDGRFWAAINGEEIVDYHGPNIGKYKLPITRIMVSSLYTGGHGPTKGYLTGLEIWSGFPCGNGVSCYEFDTTRPSVPTSLDVKLTDNKTSASVLLTWEASSDAVGVAAYYIYRNGTKIGVSTDTNFRDKLSGSGKGALYSYTVRAVDAADNLSGASPKVSIVY